MSDSFATLWTVACQAPLSMGFSRQEYWSGLPFPSPRDLLDAKIKPTSPSWEVDSLPLSYLAIYFGVVFVFSAIPAVECGILFPPAETKPGFLAEYRVQSPNH